MPYVNFSLSGISRDEDLIKLTQFMAAETITFSNIIENGASAGSPIIILDENPIYKEVGAIQINNLLTEKFTFNNHTPTFAELKSAVDTGEDNIGIQTIYAKLKDQIGDQTFELDGVGAFDVWQVFEAIFPDSASMAKSLGDIKISVDIGTCTYPGSTDENAATYPVIIWGMNPNQ